LGGHPERTWEKQAPKSPDKQLQPDGSSSTRKKGLLDAFRRHRSRSRDGDVSSPPAQHVQIREHSPATKAVFWPKALLGELLPESRIYTFGYNADIASGWLKGTGQNTISQNANDLLVDCAAELEGQVCFHHSLTTFPLTAYLVEKDHIRGSQPWWDTRQRRKYSLQ
jgi:hypothetical protein